MKDQAIILRIKQLSHLVDTNRGYAKHGEADGRFFSRYMWDLVLNHAAQGVRRVAEYGAGNTVEPGDIGHRVDHGNIVGSDIGCDVACRHG